jgi:hypothetical protein
MDNDEDMLVTTNFTISKIQEYKSICLDEQEELKPETQSIAFTCALIGIANLTEYTIDEWMTRLKILRECGYSVGVHLDEDWWPSEELVRKHIGLETDAEELTQQDFAIWLEEELRAFVNARQVSHLIH